MRHIFTKKEKRKLITTIAGLSIVFLLFASIATFKLFLAVFFSSDPLPKQNSNFLNDKKNNDPESEWRINLRSKYKKENEEKYVKINNTKIHYEIETEIGKSTPETALYISFLNEEYKKDDSSDKIIYNNDYTIADRPNKFGVTTKDIFVHPITSDSTSIDMKDSICCEIINLLTAYYYFNPNKVYLIGGEEVWKIATRHPDKFAAVAIISGNPNNTSLTNLYNVPTRIWCNANNPDTNMVISCKKVSEELNTLRTNEQKRGYNTSVSIEEQNSEDDLVSLKIDQVWLNFQERNPYPSKIIWEQSDVASENCYWIKVPKGEAKQGKKVIATYNNNVVEILQSDYTHLTIMLTEKMANLEKPVVVKVKGKTIFNRRLKINKTYEERSLIERNDPKYNFCSHIDIAF
ncbi:MAG: hypothetical protein IKQ46_03875 [Bacteroidales bacterium]|nr:hypothetical protein [Bacteroidales bacterium]